MEEGVKVVVQMVIVGIAGLIGLTVGGACDSMIGTGNLVSDLTIQNLTDTSGFLGEILAVFLRHPLAVIGGAVGVGAGLAAASTLRGLL